MSAFREKCRTFYGGNIFITDGLAVLNRLAQRACRGMNAATNVAYVVDSPALTFTDHQYLILPGLGPLGQLDAQRNVSRMLGMVEALATSALSGSVVRLENGSDLSRVLCCGSRVASLSSFARPSLR